MKTPVLIWHSWKWSLELQECRNKRRQCHLEKEDHEFISTTSFHLLPLTTPHTRRSCMLDRPDSRRILLLRVLRGVGVESKRKRSRKVVKTSMDKLLYENFLKDSIRQSRVREHKMCESYHREQLEPSFQESM